MVSNSKRSILAVYTYRLHLWLGYGLSLPIDLSLLKNIHIGGLDLGCLYPKSHDLLFFLHVEVMRCCVDINAKEENCWIQLSNCVLSLILHKCHISYQLVLTKLT